MRAKRRRPRLESAGSPSTYCHPVELETWDLDRRAAATRRRHRRNLAASVGAGIEARLAAQLRGER